MRRVGRILAAALTAATLAAVHVAAPAEPEPAAERPDAALLARVRAAAGEADALAALRGFRARGRVLPLVEGSVRGVRVVVDLSGSLREDVRDAGGEDATRLVGKLAWEGRPHPKAASGEAAARIIRRFRELAAPLALGVAVPESLAAEGETPEGWTRLVAPTPEGGRLAWDVEEETGRVRRFSEQPAAPPDAPLVETEFDDFREVDGIAWPFRATTYVGGRPFRETVWDKFEPASELPAEEFLPPGQRSGL